MRADMTRDRLRALLREIARSAPRGRKFRVHLVGGGTALLAGWRTSTVDADLFSEDDAVFRDVQAIKERLNVNVEFVRPEHFVPPLEGADERHVPVETIGSVSFSHYDPYSQVFAKVVRGFRHDLEDAANFVKSGLVDPERLRRLVARVPEAAFAKYPRLTRAAVLRAVDAFATGAA